MTTLRDLRKQAGKTCAEVAEALGVTSQAVRNYEHGIRMLGVDKIKPLANIYGVAVEEVIDCQMQTLKIRQTD